MKCLKEYVILYVVLRVHTLGNRIILDSSMVEHSAVNRVVVGSSPTRGVKYIVLRINNVLLFGVINYIALF